MTQNDALWNSQWNYRVPTSQIETNSAGLSKITELNSIVGCMVLVHCIAENTVWSSFLSLPPTVVNRRNRLLWSCITAGDFSTRSPSSFREVDKRWCLEVVMTDVIHNSTESVRFTKMWTILNGVLQHKAAEHVQFKHIVLLRN